MGLGIGVLFLGLVNTELKSLDGDFLFYPNFMV